MAEREERIKKRPELSTSLTDSFHGSSGEPREKKRSMYEERLGEKRERKREVDKA